LKEFRKKGLIKERISASIFFMTKREAELSDKVEKLELQILLLKEELYLARHRLFGRKSETAVTRNLSLFDELPIGIVEKPTKQQAVNVAAHVREKKAGRKPLPEDLPRTDIVHDLPDEEKQCACGCAMVKIGEEVSEKLAIIPQQMYVERHIRPKYACHVCEGSGDEDKPAVRTAPVPPSIIPRSITTPGLLATIFTNKFCDHLPFHRQEEIFSRSKLDLSRQDMSNWAIKVGQAVEPLIQLLEQQLLSYSFIQMDETTLQVLGESERSNTAKSYMWLARGGPPNKKVVLYRYQPTRAAKHPATFLAEYEGYLQTDGYEAYSTAIKGKTITHVGCWAHARRKFDEAAKASKEPGLAMEAIHLIRNLYILEKKLRALLDAGKLSPDIFMAQRKELAEPILKEIEDWLLIQSDRVLPSSLLGKAIAYTLGQWDKLVRYTDRAEITPDNNACENAIRPFVLGRKNWGLTLRWLALNFRKSNWCQSKLGWSQTCCLLLAYATDNIYTLIETAKTNGLKPWDYLHRVCELLPITPENTLHTLLPFA
jgi:transposase